MNSFLRQARGLIVVCVALLCGAGVASAQGLGAISGTVVDGTGASVPSANVVLTRVKTGETVAVQTHPDGLYVFPSLSPADYRIDVTAQGFKKYEQGGITLLADQSLTLNVSLQVGSEQVTVNVEASAPQVNTTTGSLSQVIGQQQVNELPLNGRNAAALTTLVAGVVIAPNAQADQGNTKTFPVAVTITANGTRVGQTNYLLDGGNNIDEYTNVNAPFPMPDAVQEFSVQTSNYNAGVRSERRWRGQYHHQERRQQIPRRPVRVSPQSLLQCGELLQLRQWRKDRRSAQKKSVRRHRGRAGCDTRSLPLQSLLLLRRLSEDDCSHRVDQRHGGGSSNDCTASGQF